MSVRELKLAREVFGRDEHSELLDLVNAGDMVALQRRLNDRPATAVELLGLVMAIRGRSMNATSQKRRAAADAKHVDLRMRKGEVNAAWLSGNYKTKKACAQALGRPGLDFDAILELLKNVRRA